MVIGSQPEPSDAATFGPFRLISAARLLTQAGEPVALSSRALDILIALVERPGEVVSRRDLIKKVWPDVIVGEANLRVHVAGLRKALGDGREGARYIASVPGRGYCFVAPVQRTARPGFPAAGPADIRSARPLPAKLRRMVGRDETVKALSEQLISRRFVSIVGPGGMGKTTVAVALAHRVAADFPDAIYFVDLGALNDAALVVPALASMFGCLGQTQDSLSTLVAFLEEKRVLVVLDNCEHVVETVVAFAERLFREAPLAHIIATSREALRVEGENVHLLQPLASPIEEAQFSASDALASPAVQLFMERAMAGGYSQDLTDEDAAAVARICRQLDGVPLAIELTAGRVSTYGIKPVADLIGDRLALLWQGRRSAPRQQTLRATLDWSYDLLSENEKKVLCRLSVFVGAFTLDGAQAVADEPDRNSWYIADVIQNLVDKSLVSVSRTHGPNAYQLFHTTRAYAAVRLAERGEDNTTARRHALYYAELLSVLGTDFFQDRDLSAYSRQIGDIGAALAWSFGKAGDAAVAVALGVAAVPLLVELSMLNECRHWCKQTLLALDDRGTKLELTLQLALVISSLYTHGNQEELRAALEAGLRLAESLRDREYKLHFLAGLNVYRSWLTEFKSALVAAQLYAATAAEVGTSRELVVADWMVGASHHFTGNQKLAHESFQRGFERAAAAGVTRVHYFGYDHRVRAIAGHAHTLWLHGFPDRAANLVREGIQVAEAEGHPVTLCIAFLYAIPIFLGRGDLQIAEQLSERLVSCSARHSLGPYGAGGLAMRGQVLVARGDVQLGVESLRLARATLHSDRLFIIASMCSRALAEGLARLGSPDEALQIIDVLLADAGNEAATYELPDWLRARADVLIAASPSNISEAESLLIQSMALARQQAALCWELRSAIALTRLWNGRDRRAEALRLLREVHGRFTEGFSTRDLTEAARLLA